MLAAQPDLAWRLVFLTGVVPGARSRRWIRRRVDEPEVWRRERAPSIRGWRSCSHPRCGARRFGGLAMCLVTLVTWWGTNAFLPFVADHLAGPPARAPPRSRGIAAWATLLFTLGGFLGTLATIPLARLGRRPLFAIYLAGAALSRSG